MMRSTSPSGVHSATRPYVLLVALLLAVVGGSLIVGEQSTVRARQYAKYGKKKKNYGATYAAQIKKCQGQCGGKNSVIRGCVARARAKAIRNCRAVFREDRAQCTDGQCRRDRKFALTFCVRNAGVAARKDIRAISGKKYGIGRCNGCCVKMRGSTGCLGYFASSRFYGSYRYHHRLKCVDETASPSGALVGEVTDTIRRRLALALPWLSSGW